MLHTPPPRSLPPLHITLVHPSWLTTHKQCRYNCYTVVKSNLKGYFFLLGGRCCGKPTHIAITIRFAFKFAITDRLQMSMAAVANKMERMEKLIAYMEQGACSGRLAVTKESENKFMHVTRLKNS